VRRQDLSAVYTDCRRQEDPSHTKARDTEETSLAVLFLRGPFLSVYLRNLQIVLFLQAETDIRARNLYNRFKDP